MTRLAVPIRLDTRTGTVVLRPTLRAAFALAKEFETFTPILKGIGEGNVTVLARLLGECVSFGALADPFDVPGRSLASRIAELQPIATNLVFGLLGADPDAKEEAGNASTGSAKPESIVERCEKLFGFATGILRWTPEATWNAAPGEIMEAWEFRSDAFTSPEDRAKVERQKRVKALPITDQTRLAFANLGTRREIDAG